MLSHKTNHPNITKKGKKLGTQILAVALDRKRILFYSSVVKTFSSMKKTSKPRKTPLTYISANSELKILAAIKIRNLPQDTQF